MRMRSKRMWLFFCMSLMVIFAAYRVVVFRPDVWFDEAFSWKLVTHFPISHWFAAYPIAFFLAVLFFFAAAYLMLVKKYEFTALLCFALAVLFLSAAGIHPADVHPPVYYLVLKGWIFLAGESEIALRSLSLIFGLLAMWQIWEYVNKRYGEKVAGVAVLLVGIGTTYIHYFTEIRMYSLVLFLSVLSFNMLRDRLEGKGWLLGYSLVLISLPMVHYFAGLVPVIHALIWWREKKDWRSVRDTFGPIFVGMVPIAVFFWVQKARIVGMWLSRPTVMSWISSISFGLNDGAGLLATLDVVNFWFIVFVLGLVAWFVLKAKDKWTTTEFALVLFPQVIGIVIAMFYHTYHHRFFLVTLWFLPVLLALAIVKVWEKKRVVAVLLMIVIVGVMLFNQVQKYTANVTQEGEHTELRRGAEFLRGVNESIIVHESPFSSIPTEYYLRDTGKRNVLYTELTPGQLTSAGGDAIVDQDKIFGNESQLPERFLYYEADGILSITNSSVVLFDLDGLRIRDATYHNVSSMGSS